MNSPKDFIKRYEAAELAFHQTHTGSYSPAERDTWCLLYLFLDRNDQLLELIKMLATVLLEQHR
jgi:hypothetical protein